MAGRRIRVGVVVAAMCTAALLGGYAIGATRAASPVAVRDALAAKDNPIGAKGRTLGLTRVTIPAGVVLALHHHPGTQVAYVASGTLTYTVKRGMVPVLHGTADASPTVVRSIRAGQSGRIAAGEWIVEEPSTVHWAANRTTKPVVIYLATLFPTGDPPAIPVK